MSGNIQSLYVPTLQAAMKWGLGNEERLHELGTIADVCKSVSKYLEGGDMFAPALLRDVFVTVVAAEKDLPQPTHEVTASLAKLIKVAHTVKARHMSDLDFRSVERAIPQFGRRIEEAQTVALDAKTHLDRFLISARIAAGESVGGIMSVPERQYAFAEISSHLQTYVRPNLPNVRDSHPNISQQMIVSMITLATCQLLRAHDPAYHAIKEWQRAERSGTDGSWSEGVRTGITWWLARRIQAQPEPKVVTAAKNPDIQRFMDLPARSAETPNPSKRLALFAEAASLVETD